MIFQPATYLMESTNEALVNTYGPMPAESWRNDRLVVQPLIVDPRP